MTITVYVWLSDSGNKRVGHGSIRLSNGTYISWWPEGGKGAKPKVTGTQKRTLEEDIRDEGGEPSYTIQIPSSVSLDESAMKSWWDTFKTSGTWSVRTNCCWVVEEALIKGGIEKYLKVKELIHFSHPNQLLALMKRIEAINVATGNRFMANTTVEAGDLDAAIRGILEGTSDTDLVSKFSFK